MVNGNFGIVLFASGDGSGSFTDRKGNAGTVQTLSAATWRVSDSIYIGRGQRCLVTISGVLSGGAATVKVRGEIKNSDAPGITSGVTWKWASVAMVRGDGSAAANVENTITDANLRTDGPTVGGDATRDVVLMTENTGPSGTFRIVILTSVAPGAADKVIVAVEVQ